MKAKKLFISAALFAAASVGFISCGEQFFDPTSMKGDLSVFLRDQSSDDVLTDATFSLLSGTEVVIATNGTGSFKGIPAGTYLLKVEKTGYATYLVTLQIGRIDDNGTYLSHVTQTVWLYKLGAKLSGKALYHKQGSSLKLPAVDAVLTLSMNSSIFAHKIYTATVAADGSYLFENLPENASVNVKSVVTIDGVVYQVETGLNLKAAGQEFAQEINFSATVENLWHSSSPQTVKPDEDMVFIFNCPVDISRIKRFSAETILLGNPTGDIMVSAIWSDGNKTLTIANAAGTAWPDVTQLHVSVEATDGGGDNLYPLTGGDPVSFNWCITIKKESPVGEIVGFFAGGNRVVPYSTDKDTLRWNVPKDSINTEYRVYAKAEDGNAYKLLTRLTPPATGILGGNSGDYKWFQNGGVIYFERSFPTAVFSDKNHYYDYQIEAFNTVNVERSAVKRLAKPTVADILSFTADTIGTNNAKAVKFTWKVPEDSITTHFKLYWKLMKESTYKLEGTLRAKGSGAYTYEPNTSRDTYSYKMTNEEGIFTLESLELSFDVTEGSDFKIEAYNIQPDGTSVYSTSAKTFQAKRK